MGRVASMALCAAMRAALPTVIWRPIGIRRAGSSPCSGESHHGLSEPCTTPSSLILSRKGTTSANTISPALVIGFSPRNIDVSDVLPLTASANAMALASVTWAGRGGDETQLRELVAPRNRFRR